MIQFRKLIIASAVALAPVGALAGTITDGFTFAVASNSDTSVGTHFHSSTGGDFGNPAGKAEVGSFSNEEVRGLSEYDLTGLSAATSAFVTFEVDALGGLFPGTNDFPYVGSIGITSYTGNNLEDLSDYSAASTGAVGSFSSLGLGIGDTLSFDITSIFNSAIAGLDSSLGIRLAILDAPNGGALTFDSFRLTTDDQTTSPVPLPAGLPLLLAALGGMAVLRRRQQKS